MPGNQALKTDRLSFPGRIRSWLPGLAKAAFAAILIAWLIRRGALDLHVVAEALSHWPLVSAVVVMFIVQSVLLAYRWDLLLRTQKAGLAFRDVFSLTMIGLLFNVVSPGAVGGDLVKSYYVHRHARERRAEAIATIVLDRIIGMITLFIVASVAAVPALFFSAGNKRLHALALGAVVAAMVGLGGLAGAIRMSRSAARSHRNPVMRFIIRAFGSLLIYENQPGALIRPMAVSGLGWLVSCGAFYVAALAAGAPAFPMRLIFLVPLGLMATALPVSPGGIGVGQVAFAELFRIASDGKYGFGANAYTVLQAVQILYSLSGFFFYLGWRRESRPPARATA